MLMKVVLSSSMQAARSELNAYDAQLCSYGSRVSPRRVIFLPADYGIAVLIIKHAFSTALSSSALTAGIAAPRAASLGLMPSSTRPSFRLACLRHRARRFLSFPLHPASAQRWPRRMIPL